MCFGAGNLNSRQCTINSGPESQKIAHMVLAANYQIHSPLTLHRNQHSGQQIRSRTSTDCMIGSFLCQAQFREASSAATLFSHTSNRICVWFSEDLSFPPRLLGGNGGPHQRGAECIPPTGVAPSGPAMPRRILHRRTPCAAERMGRCRSSPRARSSPVRATSWTHARDFVRACTSGSRRLTSSQTALQHLLIRRSPRV